MLSLTIRGRLPSGINKKEALTLARAAWKRAGGEGSAEMSISIVDDKKIRTLNKQYRGKDKVTDVLSFGMEGQPRWVPLPRALRGKMHKTADLRSSPGQRSRKGYPEKAGHALEEPQELGDVFISLQQVRRQAKRIGRPTSAEFALMVVHGTLHLMGFDHETLAQERRMFGLQHDILLRARFI